MIPRRAWMKWSAAAVLVAALWCVAPPFRIVPLAQAKKAESFDAEKTARNFWETQLFPAPAVEAAVLLPALAANFENAGRQHGKNSGLGTNASFLMKGAGVVVTMDAKGAAIAFTAGEPAALLLETGPVTGNEVRDCTGLLRHDAFVNSQDFNALSARLNARVENEVQPAVKALKPGARVNFLACATPAQRHAAARPLQVIPLKVEVTP